MGVHRFLCFGGDASADTGLGPVRARYARMAILPPQHAVDSAVSAYHVRLIGVSVNGARP